MQIIVFALVMGIVSFLGVVVFIRHGPNPPNAANNTGPMLTYLGIGFAALMLVLHFVLPLLFVSNVRRLIVKGAWNPAGRGDPVSAEHLSRMSDADKLCSLFPLYQSQLIVSAAVLEGAAFFNLIAYLLEGDVVSLVVVGLLLAVMLVRFPTNNRAERFLSEQLELLRQAV
jgi:hypothetical protein